MSQFTTQLVSIIFDAQFNNFDDNYDFYRFGKSKRKSLSEKISSKIGKILKKLRLYARRYLNRPNVYVLAQWLDHLKDLEWIYAKLEDKDSKELLIQLIAYRIMGHQAIRLPLSNKKYWERLSYFDKIQKGADSIDIGFMNWHLYLTDLNVINIPFKMYTNPSGLVMLELQQYTCEKAGIVLGEGDVVMDCGGCYGDTALDFARQVGKSGFVYTFEFVASNLEFMVKNLDLNPNLKQCIEIVKNPLWSTSDLPVYLEGSGPASRVSFNPISKENYVEFKTVSIDDLVSRKRLSRVSLIKMDIEGAEFEVLKGAKETLLRFKPNLALSVYHRPEHFYQLAQFIDSLNLGYQFYLGHFTIHQEETVLFARAN